MQTLSANQLVKTVAIVHVRPAKIQISLAFTQSDQTLHWAHAKFLHVNNEDSDQTARMRRLI